MLVTHYLAPTHPTGYVYIISIYNIYIYKLLQFESFKNHNLSSLQETRLNKAFALTASQQTLDRLLGAASYQRNTVEKGCASGISPVIETRGPKYIYLNWIKRSNTSSWISKVCHVSTWLYVKKASNQSCALIASA